MRPIHKATLVKGMSECQKYIQVKNGFVVATNGYVFVKLPLASCFPAGIVLPTEELYFDGKSWGLAKMDKAVSMKRDELTFYALDKSGMVIGSILAVTRLFANYPDVDCITPDRSTVQAIYELPVDPTLLVTVAEIFKTKDPYLKLSFYGDGRIVLIQGHQIEGIAGIMPLNSKNVHFDIPAPKEAK